MSAIPLLSAHDVIKCLYKIDFVVVSRKGSHIKLKGLTKGMPRIVIVPDMNEIPKGTLRSIIRQSGLSREAFLSLLK